MRYEDRYRYSHPIPLSSSEDHIVGYHLWEAYLRRNYGWKRDYYCPKLILSDQRLVHFKKGVFNDVHQSYNLDKISSVTYEENFRSSKIEIEEDQINNQFKMYNGHANELVRLMSE
ncbi:PH domain-containing protein [Natrinema versiforme]|uniref:PH domain-containing protein n=1 Tax=Natrinema TaxID=88723 RepID=UPI0015865F04